MFTKSQIKKILTLFILPIFILACGKKEIKKIEKNSFLFGTYINIAVYDEDEKKGNEAIDKAFAEIERVDKKFNSKVEDSIISRLNRGEIREVELDEEGVYLFTHLKNLYELSHKKYDITIKPLLDLWDFGEGVKLQLPSAEEIDVAKSKVDFSKVLLRDNKLIVEDENIELDTGSFLKGYAVARAKEVLEKEGIKSAFLSSISSIETLGKKPDGSHWRIGIENPINTEELLGIVELDDQSMGVSGDYQTYVEIDGKRYHHIIDKTTGYPVADKKMVVVISDNGFLSDMYSTTFFMMPIDEVMSYAQDNGLNVLIVDNNMKIYESQDFKLIQNK